VFTLAVTASADLYCTVASGPCTAFDIGKFKSLPDMATPRRGHSATLLADGNGSLERQLQAARARLAERGCPVPEIEATARYDWVHRLLAGVAGGLLGVGGGLVIVPLLLVSFARQGLPSASLMHLALGTSMASIVFTSISSLRAHDRRGAVDWTIVRRITPGILAGTFFGTWVASRLSTTFLKWFFVVFLYLVAVQMLLDRKPRPSREIPGAAGTSAVGGVIGVISSLVGIGGGSLSVPFMAWCNIPVHRAIGTSAAIGLPIALAGSAGYVINGFGAPDLPPHTLGYVSLPALAGIVVASVSTAPLGARLAHSLPVPKLKRAFALLLLVMGTRLLSDLLK
jgi:uncharacterized membrane protein YfcA